MSWHFLLQWIFSTQGSNPHFLCLLYCRWIPYLLNHQGSSKSLINRYVQFKLKWTVHLLNGVYSQWWWECVCLVTQLCLCNPMGCSPPAPSAHWIFQARILEWVGISFSRESSWAGDRNCNSCISYIGWHILWWK